AAAGFRVETPTSRIVDLGTEFCVAVEEGGATEIRVLQGAVELEARTPEGPAGERWRLGEGEARRLEPSPRPAADSDGAAFHGVLDVNGQRREFTDRAAFEKARREMLEEFRRLAPDAVPGWSGARSFRGVLSINGQQMEFDSPEEFDKARQRL